MKHIIHKLYWNYEREEKWLNDMSAKGLALIDYSVSRYVFEDCNPGEYIYRIELLENWPSHPESKKYIGFMEENGVEHITSYMRWVYFRKKASDGEFNIYSDIDSRIKHYQRVSTLYTILFIMNAINCINMFSQFFTFNDLSYILTFPAGCLCLAVSLGLLSLALPLWIKIGKLKKEKKIRDE